MVHPLGTMNFMEIYIQWMMTSFSKSQYCRPAGGAQGEVRGKPRIYPLGSMNISAMSKVG